MSSTKLEMVDTLKATTKMIVYSILFVPYVVITAVHKVIERAMDWSADFDKY